MKPVQQLLPQCCFHGCYFIVLSKYVWQRSYRRNLELVNLSVTFRVMFLNVLEFGRVLEGRVVPVLIS